MRVLEILYEMSTMDAINVFKHVGVDVSGMTPEQIKDARNQVIRKHHPDLGGDVRIAQMINAAYDLLKQGVPVVSKNNGSQSTKRGPFRQSNEKEDRKARYPNIPEWAWAGYAGGLPDNGKIYRNDYTDVNFIKKTMWEKSGRSQQEYSVWGYDGAYFRNVFTCYGSPQVFADMAHAMFDWQTKGGNPYKCRAVFVSKAKSKDLYLIYADDTVYADHPIKVHHKSFNTNPGNDQQFLRTLPKFLDGLMQYGRGQ